MVLVETVGVGQSETDIATLADTTVLVVQPFAGDVLQFIKSGVMEIPDILAVNKADDQALARKAVADVQTALTFEQGSLEGSWQNPVLAVSAATNLNIDILDDAMTSHYQHLQSTNKLGNKRADQTMAWAVGEILHEVGQRGLATLGGVEGVRSLWEQQTQQWSASRKLATLLDRVRYRT